VPPVRGGVDQHVLGRSSTPPSSNVLSPRKSASPRRTTGRRRREEPEREIRAARRSSGRRTGPTGELHDPQAPRTERSSPSRTTTYRCRAPPKEGRGSPPAPKRTARVPEESLLRRVDPTREARSTRCVWGMDDPSAPSPVRSHRNARGRERPPCRAAAPPAFPRSASTRAGPPRGAAARPPRRLRRHGTGSPPKPAGSPRDEARLSEARKRTAPATSSGNRSAAAASSARRRPSPSAKKRRRIRQGEPRATVFTRMPFDPVRARATSRRRQGPILPCCARRTPLPDADSPLLIATTDPLRRSPSRDERLAAEEGGLELTGELRLELRHG